MKNRTEINITKDAPPSQQPKSLLERFFEQLGELLLYLQNPVLSQEERKQGWQIIATGTDDKPVDVTRSGSKKLTP